MATTAQLRTCRHDIRVYWPLQLEAYIVVIVRDRGGSVAQGPMFLTHVVRTRQGSGFEGLGWVPLCPKRSHQGPYGPIWMCISMTESYTDTGQSSDISRLVSFRRTKSGSNGFPSESCFGTMGPDGA